MRLSNIIFFINKHAFFFGITLSVLYNLPYLILWDKAVYNVGDCLDGLPILHALVKTNNFFSISNDIYFEDYLGGAIPRNALTPGPLNIMNLLHYFFEPISAFVFNKLISVLIGFVGMFFFLKNNILKEFKLRVFCLLIALNFSFLPLKAHFGCGVFTITPLIFYSFSNLFKNKGIIINIGIIFFSGFAGSIVYNSIFILFYLVIYWLFICIRMKKIIYAPLIGIFVFMVSIVICDLNILLLHIFNTDFFGHRSLNPIQSMDFEAIFFNFRSYFLNEKYAHVATLHYFIIFWLVGLFIFWRKLEKKNKVGLIFCLGLVILNNLFASIIHWELFDVIKKKISILGSFGFYRFTWLNPFFWWMLFAWIVRCFFQIINIKNKNKTNLIFLIILCLSGILYVLKNSWEYRSNLSLLFKKQRSSYDSITLSFHDFYSESLFNSIKEYIGKDPKSYRVGNIGLHPAVALYNGFYTVDGYATLYSANYKDKFRDAIENELIKMPSQKLKFDNWGNRCYFFSSELIGIWNHKDEIISKNRTLSLENISFDFSKIKKLPCDYIFSTVPINNYELSKLKFVKIFEKKDLPYRIFLYELI
tara:strand:- start:12102 stop:13868 length:1767 start_codon:yes stop_codon:yes gene_type:complete